MDKKGYSTAFTWVFGLVSMFGLGVMYVTFNYVLTSQLVPIIKNQVNNSFFPVDNATQIQIYAGIDNYMIIFNLLPIILIVIIAAYMFFAAIRKERDEQF